MGYTCSLMLVYNTERDDRICRLCQAIDRKSRRRSAELSRLERWKTQGDILIASKKRSRKLVLGLEYELQLLGKEREFRKKCFSKRFSAVTRDST